MRDVVRDEESHQQQGLIIGGRLNREPVGEGESENLNDLTNTLDGNFKLYLLHLSNPFGQKAQFKALCNLINYNEFYPK